jgi:phosphatidylglycerophosphate synthase
VRPNDPSLTPSELTVSRNFRLADLVTIMNGFCGSFSLFSSANYLLTSDDYYLRNALLFPLAGLIFDFFDGKVARWRKSTSMLGQELDSLADLVCPPRVFISPLRHDTIGHRYHLELRLRFWALSSAFARPSTRSPSRASSAAA